MFQGATARNKALVAAFERLLDVEVVVSPYCHVMGAFGVARLVRQTMANSASPVSFPRLDLDKRKIAMRKETCDLCQNDCTITFADIEGVQGSPGMIPVCWSFGAGQNIRHGLRVAWGAARGGLRTGGADAVEEDGGGLVVGVFGGRVCLRRLCGGWLGGGGRRGPEQDHIRCGMRERHRGAFRAAPPVELAPGWTVA